MIGLKQLITQMINRFGGESFLCARNSSITTGECMGYFDKSSGLVSLNFWYRNDDNIAASTTLFTIPANYRPADVVYGSGLVINSANAITPYRYRILADGSIRQDASNSARSGNAVIEYKIAVRGGNKLLNSFSRIAQILRKEVGAC